MIRVYGHQTWKISLGDQPHRGREIAEGCWKVAISRMAWYTGCLHYVTTAGQPLGQSKRCTRLFLVCACVARLVCLRQLSFLLVMCAYFLSICAPSLVHDVYRAKLAVFDHTNPPSRFVIISLPVILT